MRIAMALFAVLALTACEATTVRADVVVGTETWHVEGSITPPPTTTTTGPATGTTPPPPITTTTTPTADVPPGRDILVMGSSTTACVGPSSPTACYVTKLQQARLHDRFTTIGRGGTYVAYGTDPTKNWTTTSIPTGMEVVIVQLGINDWYVPVAATQYRADVDGLLARIRAANPAATIHWVRAWMPNYTSQARLDMWAAHATVTAAALTAVGGTFTDMPGDPAPYRVDSTGWHYNDVGHQLLADAVLSII